MIQLRALVHLGNKVACKNPQTSLVLKILRNRFQRLVSFFVTKHEKNTQNVNLIPVLVSKIKILKKKEKNDYNVWKYGIQSRSAYQSRKNSFVYYALVEQGTHEWNLKTKSTHSGECCPHTNSNFATDIRFAGNLNKEQLIRQWIDSDENIAKLGWYYSSSIIAAVFRPDNVNFVVAQMSRLYQSIQVVKRK